MSVTKLALPALAFSVKQGDLLPSIEAVLLNPDNTPLNLATATSVLFRMRKRGGSGAAKVSAAATIVTPTTGLVRYNWSATDTDTVGEYFVEWVVTFPTALPVTYPGNGWDLVTVTPNLAA